MSAGAGTDRATWLLVIAVLEARIRAEKPQLREDILTELVTGERVAGVLNSEDPEGSALGFVQKRSGARSAKVVDPDALLAWARKHTPGEVVTVETVRPSFLPRLLDAVKADGGWVDPGSGQLLDVDGVEVATGDPTLMVKANDRADALVAEALAARRLPLPGGEP